LPVGIGEECRNYAGDYPNAIYIAPGPGGKMVVSNTTFGSGQFILDYSDKRVMYK
jgi:hypothetical protein